MAACSSSFWWFTDVPTTRHECDCDLKPGHAGPHSAQLITGNRCGSIAASLLAPTTTFTWTGRL